MKEADRVNAVIKKRLIPELGQKFNFANPSDVSYTSIVTQQFTCSM
jgi:hypothetical protein